MDAEPDQLSSFFPDPPPFYKYFTVDNQERLKQIKEDTSTVDHDGSPSPSLSTAQLLSLPPELRYLVPPEPPAEDEEIHVFGEVTKVHGTEEFKNIMSFISSELDRSEVLKGWEYQQLYPGPPSEVSGTDPSVESNWSIDRQNYLFRFLRSTLLSFVELLGIVATNPTSEHKDKKLKDILTLVSNMHSLINEYRPHQARETLINLMQEQLDRKRAEVEGIRRMKEKVQQTFDEFAKGTPDKTASVPPEDGVMLSEEERRKAVQRCMWQAMDEIVGH